MQFQYLFFLDNRLYLPNRILTAQKVDLYTLNQTNYINELKDYNDSLCSNYESYVIAIKTGSNEYSYSACIKCLDDDYDNTVDNDNCSAGWTDEGGFTSVTFTTADDVYIYKGTPRASLVDIVKVYPHLVRCVGTSVCEKELMSVTAKGEDGVAPVLPNNMNAINPDVVGTYTANYSYNGSPEVTGNVIVYEHSAPRAVFSKGDNYDIPYNPTSTSEYTNKIKIDLSYSFASYDSDVYVSRFEYYKNSRWEVLCVPNLEENHCYGVINSPSSTTLKLRFVDTKNRISAESSYVLRLDTTAPVCTLSGSNATCSDTGGSKISKVYFGTSDSPTTADFTSITLNNSYTKDMSGSESGTYYLVVMDEAGNRSTAISYTR